MSAMRNPMKSCCWRGAEFMFWRAVKARCAGQDRPAIGALQHTAARPTQAALGSAASCSVGAVLPIAAVATASPSHLIL